MTTICRLVWRCVRPSANLTFSNENNPNHSNWLKLNVKRKKVKRRKRNTKDKMKGNFMQNTAIIYEKKLDYLSARHEEKGNKVLHIDTLTSVNDIESRLDDKMVRLPCSIKSLNKRMDSVCFTVLPLHTDGTLQCEFYLGI